jgi:hypothetical protein
MRELEVLRKSAQDNVFRRFGINNATLPYQGGQLASSLGHVGLMKLPHIPCPPAQILDPASDNFGKFIFMADYSTIDGPDVIL